MKKYKIIRLCILITAVVLLQSCFKGDEIVKYIEVSPKKGYVRIDETKVEIGQKVLAHFINMDSVNVYSVTLNEKKVTFKQINDSTVTLILPYTSVGSDVGNFVFYCSMHRNINSDTVLVSNQINYKYEDWIPRPYIKWNSNVKVTQNDSWKFDGLDENEWKSEANMDTIKMIRKYACHDECNVTETIVFLDNGDNNLPTFLYALYNRNEWLKTPIQIKVEQFSKIIIDSWDKSSLYSGTFSSPDYSWIFWYKK